MGTAILLGTVTGLLWTCVKRACRDQRGFFGGSPHAPAAPPPPPERTDPSVQVASNQARLLARKRGGRASTILRGTGAKLGDVGSLDAPVTGDTLGV